MCTLRNNKKLFFFSCFYVQRCFYTVHHKSNKISSWSFLIHPHVNSWTVCVVLCQVVSWSPLWVECREASQRTRWAGHLPGQRVPVQTWRLCPDCPDGREEQNRREEGVSHQDYVSGSSFFCVCMPCKIRCVKPGAGFGHFALNIQN